MCVCLCSMCVCLGDSFSSPVEGNIGVSVSVIGCWPWGSVLYICLLTGCTVTNQTPRPHRGNQDSDTLSVGISRSSGNTCYVLSLCDTHTHTLIHTRTHTNITFLPCLCLSRKLLHISSLLRNTMSGWRRRRKPGEGRESRQWFPHTYKNTVSLNQSVAHVGLISMTERLCLIKTLVMYVDCLQRVLLAGLLYM